MLGNKLNVAIMGAGNIGGIMADTLNRMKNVRCYAVGSRSKDKAEDFAKRFGCRKAYDSYEKLVADKKVDLVYIATPHSEHYDHARLCIEHGKPVLCEKAFTANAAQAEDLFALAEERNVFITEAIWTRYMPMLQTIKDVLNGGAIGVPTMLTANLGYTINGVSRLTDPALAGGALLDVGVYTLNFASMIFGTAVEKITSTCTYTKTGVDEQNSITMIFEDGKMAVLNSSMLSISDRKGIIHGTKGFAVVENINNFESITVYGPDYKKIAKYNRPNQISGYEYEVEACVKALQRGLLECPQMPHEETVRIMRMMDGLREEWGIRFPFE